MLLIKYFLYLKHFFSELDRYIREFGLKGLFVWCKYIFLKLFEIYIVRSIYKLNLVASNDYKYFAALFEQNNSKSMSYRQFAKNSDFNPEVKLICFYLPQFHAIPENDTWWGAGFTEWTNVTRAVPEFIGHYQPRLPGELGFYNLLDSKVMRKQIDLAKNYGVFGFCFYYYWFNGKRLLEQPLDIWLKDKTLQLPFCYCWANENWTRRWDGLESEVLVSQTHSENDDVEFFNELVPALMDQRYIKIEGKPLILIYNPMKMPNPQKTAALWRDLAKKAGLEGIYLACVHSITLPNPYEIGFDAAIEFPPANLGNFGLNLVDYRRVLQNPDFSGEIYDYEEVVEVVLKKRRTPYKTFRGVTPSWDNSPRKPAKGHIFVNSSPQLYQHWLASAIKETVDTESAPDRRVVFINAWNEWAEGAYLEPDRRYGYAYLDSTYKAVYQYSSKISSKVKVTQDEFTRKSEIAIVLHLYFTELASEFFDLFNKLEFKIDLFITIPKHITEDEFVEIRNLFPDAYFIDAENRGRDILPFIDMLRVVNKFGYRYCCKIHSKRSLHRQDGDLWRRTLVSDLLGDNERIKQIISTMEGSKIGLIGPSKHYLPFMDYVGSNMSICREILGNLRVSASGLRRSKFIAGSMFWFNVQALETIIESDISSQNFPVENLQLDGTYAHGLERLFSFIAAKSGWKSISVDKINELKGVSTHYESINRQFSVSEPSVPPYVMSDSSYSILGPPKEADDGRVKH